MSNKKEVIKKFECFFQILILVIGIIAIGYAIGSEVRLVGAFAKGATFTDPQGNIWTKGDIVWTSPGQSPVSDGNIQKWIDFMQNRGGSPTPAHGIYGKGYEWITGAKGSSLTQPGFTISGIAQAAGWALIIYGSIKMIGGFLGVEDEKLDAVAKAVGIGVFSGMTLNTLFAAGTAETSAGVLSGTALQSIFTLGGKISLSSAAWFWGGAIAVGYFLATYKDVEQQIVEFNCIPWEAQTGGSDCEKCNKQGILPCSEYQCRSLGQACQLLNKGTEDEKCAWVNPKDVDPPVITPSEDALLDDYRYELQNTGISPPDTGVIIEYTQSADKCVPAFTPLSFGVELDEPAKCKIDYLRKDSFDEMDFFFGDSLLLYNHTIVMSLPGPDNLESENLTIQNDGEYELYTRCQDANGNSNTANFVFKYCVDPGPDTTPPLIVTTSLLNGMPIAYNQTSVDLEVYVNEPAECKWSHLDQSYDDMEESMSCSSSVLEMNAQMLYKCSTTLTGLKNNEENKFYFRCKDKPSAEEEDRNVNEESYEFTLIGTQPLVIDSVEPNGTIKDSTDIIKVELKAETSAGYKEGESTCYYSSTGDEEDYIMFYETSSYQHTQELHLPQGEYEYYIKCIDLGGNSDTEKVNFIVESDTNPPIVVRAYHDAPYLRLITNEEAECVYDTRDCSYLFEDGTKISATDDTEHFTDWNTKTNFYIKCQDEYGNQPLPNKCSIIVRAFSQE